MLTPAKINKCILFLFITLLSESFMDNRHACKDLDTAESDNITLNIHVRQYVKNYIRNNREALIAIQGRSARPFRLIDSVFGRYGLPKEMKYLAVIESELNTRALSPVGARGAWQLMPQTAQLLGLKVDSNRDERIQLGKSTVAAAKYLKDLYGEFGDWLLVLAAYNAGPAPVYRAIHRSGSRDFWALEKYLPAESRGDVKRFIASHYYFEGNGSVTTVTKGEWVSYKSGI